MGNRFQRMKKLIGEKGFTNLASSTIAIFGIGGVGSFAVEALARAGIGHLVLVDNDIIEVTNINRQIHALDSKIGRLKVEVMRERILDINPDAKVDIIPKFFQLSKNVGEFFISHYDYVIDAMDTINSKIFLVEECKKREIKVISSMGTGNKFDATRFKVMDIFQTKVDPIAKILRSHLKLKGITSLKVVCSDETPRPIKGIIGSISFVPSVAGLIISGEVIKDLINVDEEKS